MIIESANIKLFFGRGTLQIRTGINQETGNPVLTITECDKRQVGSIISDPAPNNYRLILEFENEISLDVLQFQANNIKSEFLKSKQKCKINIKDLPQFKA